MLNLVFALEIGIENESLTRDEFDFFFKNFLKFPNFKDWRKPETNFIRISDTIDTINTPLEIGIENESLTRDEFDFFFKNFLKFPNFKDWRKPETNFIRISDTIDKSAFIRLKRSLLRLYPKRRKLFEDLGESTFTYKTIIDKVNTHFAAGKVFLFKNIDRGEKPKLMESINVSFLCPDHEFRSMIWQIVYQELLAIFDFNEDTLSTLT